MSALDKAVSAAGTKTVAATTRKAKKPVATGVVKAEILVEQTIPEGMFGFKKVSEMFKSFIAYNVSGVKVDADGTQRSYSFAVVKFIFRDKMMDAKNERPSVTVSKDKEGKVKVNKIKSESDGKTYWNEGLEHFFVKGTTDARKEAWTLVDAYRKDGLFDAIV